MVIVTASADNCRASGGGGLVLVGGDLERTGRAFGGGLAGGGEADEDSTDTARGGALWDFGASTTGGLATGGAMGVGVDWAASCAGGNANPMAQTPDQWRSTVEAQRVEPWDLQLLRNPWAYS